MRSGPRLEDGEEINRKRDSSRQEKQEWGKDVVMGPCRAYARNKRHSWGAAMDGAMERSRSHGQGRCRRRGGCKGLDLGLERGGVESHRRV